MNPPAHVSFRVVVCACVRHTRALVSAHRGTHKQLKTACVRAWRRWLRAVTPPQSDTCATHRLSRITACFCDEDDDDVNIGSPFRITRRTCAFVWVWLCVCLRVCVCWCVFIYIYPNVSIGHFYTRVARTYRSQLIDLIKMAVAAGERRAGSAFTTTSSVYCS